MAIYLKIGTVSYKLPNRIIVGRGEPFKQFNDDRSIARAHLILVRKKDGVYVKDLGSETGTYIDGKKLPKKKLLKWCECHDLRIGSHPVALLATAVDKECLQVSAIKGLSNPPAQMMKWLYYLMMAVAIYHTWFINNKFSLSSKIGITAFIAALLFCAYFFYKFIFKLITPKNMNVTDIYLSNDGFTAHYDAGGNMTLKLKEIDEWRRHLGGAVVLMKNGEVYNFVQVNSREKLVQYLETQMPKKELKKSWLDNYGYAAIGVGVVLLMKFFDLTDKVSPMVFMILVIGALAYSFLFSKQKKWMPNNRFMNTKKLAPILGCLLLFVAILEFMEPNKKELALENQNYCKATKNQMYFCKYIDYDALTTKEINPEKVILACKAGNKSACSRLPQKRLPASSKKR